MASIKKSAPFQRAKAQAKAARMGQSFPHAPSTLPYESPSDRVTYAGRGVASTQKQRPNAGSVNEEGEGAHGDGIRGGSFYGPQDVAAEMRYHWLNSQTDHHAPSARAVQRLRTRPEKGNNLGRREHRSD